MTPKQKAEELINKFTHPVRWKMGQEDIAQRAKQCALITLRETIWGYLDQMPTEIQNYWQEVKQEIEKHHPVDTNEMIDHIGDSNGMVKQTAVQWLIDQLQAPCRGIPSHIIEQAKAMEKEQIEQAVNQHYVIPSNYYHKTYGNKS